MSRKANTRAASGAGTIRQRPDGRWEARVTVGTDPGTGKPIRRSLYGNTQKEVLTAMRDVLKAVDDGLYIEPTRLTLAPVARYLAKRLSALAEIRHGQDLQSTDRHTHQTGPRCCEALQAHAAPRSRLL